MSFISKDDYLKLLESVQQEDFDQIDHLDPPDTAWIPARSSAHDMLEKARARQSYGILDIVEYKREQIQEALYECINLQVGEFIIHVEEYHGRPAKLSKAKNTSPSPASELTMDIVVYQERLTTPSGIPCKMQYMMDFFQDNRFTNQAWLSHFTHKGRARNIPVETVVDMIRWLQALNRMNAFL